MPTCPLIIQHTENKKSRIKTGYFHLFSELRGRGFFLIATFKSAVTVREYGEVSSILMLSRQKQKNPHGTFHEGFYFRMMTSYFL